MDDRYEHDAIFVLVVSKLCNLRCKYCYEYPDLGNKARMSLEQLERLFRNVAASFPGDRRVRIKFTWQGGEPLLIEPSFYRQALAIQKQIFGATPHRISNFIQTNLTVLDEERIALLREHFDCIGVSLDLFGGLRVNKLGVCRENKTLESFERLLELGLPLGGITVLTRANIEHLAEIYRFYRDRRVPFRLLPLHRGPFPSGQGFEIDAEDAARAMCTMIDLWVADDHPVPIMPIEDYLRGILAMDAGYTQLAYDKGRKESVFIVGVDGAIGGVNDLLDAEHSYGNIFEHTLAEILASPAHQREVEAARARQTAACSDCRFYKSACSGYPVGEGGKELSERDASGAIRCVMTRAALEHVERRLSGAGMLGRRWMKAAV